jgi:hypothetical protein
MSKENAENIQTAQVNPAPANVETPASVPANGAVSAPVVSPAEKQDAKTTAAFIKMRQELRELKAKQTVAPAVTPPPATPEMEQPKPESIKPIAPPVAPITVNSIEVESANAITELGKDKDLASIPGAIIDLIDMVDNDPRLSRLHNVDPTLAFREAKGILMGKYGISPAPSVPMTATPSGGMSGGNVNLEALLTQVEAATPGTRKYAELVSKVNAEMQKIGK